MVNDPIDFLPRTRAQTIAKLKKLGIGTYADLLSYYPHRYENFSLIAPIGSVQEGETVTVIGTVEKTSQVFTHRGMTIQKITLADYSGTIELVWYNQPYIVRIFQKGMKMAAAGTVKHYLKEVSMEPKEYEAVHEGRLIHTGRLIPVYPEFYGLSSRTIRDKINFALTSIPAIPEWLPEALLKKERLMDEDTAYRHIHQPPDPKAVELAKRRLGYDELFTIQLAAQLIKAEWKKDKAGHVFSLDIGTKEKIEAFTAALPFRVTRAQERAIREILDDLAQIHPMNRFLQGDVGSGKTVVAAVAAYFAFLNGFQTLYMAPTEILAQQHYRTFLNLLERYGLKIGLQTGSTKSLTKKKRKEFDILIGTHAILFSDINTAKTGLVIIDEQHRFGVAQRSLLKQKGLNPHLLTMTATPIPRTVALTVYGELDMSILDEMPAGRLPVKTYLVPAGKRPSAYEWIKKLISRGDQVFIICPLIEESETETLQSVRAATKEYERLQKEVFAGYKLALLHGRMKAKEKEQVMLDFKEKRIDILVSTSVVEVGIDIPNATVMVIEAAERFGLAQLHQLRGRVGRGEKQSYCLLFSGLADPAALNRLKFFAKTVSGLALAEYDLKIRGPGELFGTMQHGYRELKIASFSDLPLIEATRRVAREFTESGNLEAYPAIKERLEKYQIRDIARD